MEMTSALDTTDREKLLKMLEALLDEDEMDMVKTLSEKIMVTIEIVSSQK